jgi:hypothetical protein
MMENFPLPPELQRLERHLTARERPQPSYQAKQRLLCSVRAERRRSQARGRWTFAVAMAATVLVWLNLSLCATKATDCGLGLVGPHQPVENGAEQIHQLLPDLPPREAARQAVLLRAGSGVIPCPRLSSGQVALRRNSAWTEFMN